MKKEKNYTSTVTEKGEIIIPTEIRKKYKIKLGTKIHFVEDKGNIRIMPITPALFKANIGFLRTKGKLLKALMEEEKREREL